MSPNPVVTWPKAHSRWRPTTMSGDTLVLSRSFLSGGPPDDPNEPQDPDLGRKAERAPYLRRTAEGLIEVVNGDPRYPVHIADGTDFAVQAATSYYAVESAAENTLAPEDSTPYTLRPGQIYLIAVGPPPPRLEEDPHYVVSVSIPIDAPVDVPLDDIPTNLSTGLEPSTEAQRLIEVNRYLARNEPYRLALAYEAYQFILGQPGASRVSPRDVRSHLGPPVLSDARGAVLDRLFPGVPSYDRFEADEVSGYLVAHGVLTKRDVRLACAKRRENHPTLPHLIAD